MTRKLVVLVVLLVAPAAQADVGIGLFVGRPTGLDLKIGLSPRTGLDLLGGIDTFRQDAGGYAHVTYLVTPVVGGGEAVIVPLRIGIGVAVYDFGDTNAGVRVPLEIGLRFRRVPTEIYGEICPLFQFVHDADVILQGGVGVRFYF
ncbi:MAG TPA: hypothetical protein VLX92_22415 [Kofleriaceae bacterium]|nr:hypothetical protein [Kofleriaceae bacterium]